MYFAVCRPALELPVKYQNCNALWPLGSKLNTRIGLPQTNFATTISDESGFYTTFKECF